VELVQCGLSSSPQYRHTLYTGPGETRPRPGGDSGPEPRTWDRRAGRPPPSYSRSRPRDQPGTHVEEDPVESPSRPHNTGRKSWFPAGPGSPPVTGDLAQTGRQLHLGLPELTHHGADHRPVLVVPGQQ
jgi:hypothetical protein